MVVKSATAKEGDFVRVNYKGTLDDGGTITNPTYAYSPFTLSLDQVLPSMNPTPNSL